MDDQRIIDRVLSGETAAFAQLIRRHQQMAYALALSVVKQDADAQDAVQQGFVQAFTKLASFKGQASFGTWLNRIIINEALRILRRRKRAPLEEWGTDLAQKPTVNNEALLQLQREDRHKVIRHVFSLMPAREALVLHLFYLEEQSVKETAYCTGLTTNHVKVLLNRGRNRFYSLCEKHPDLPNPTEML